MNIKDFLKRLNKGIVYSSEIEMLEMFNNLSQKALKITMKLNNGYNSPDKVRKLFSKLINKKVDKSFRLFPPFYTDCGKNIEIGKNVFINACCKFQDQGGITIGDNTFIGHNVTIATINHDLNPINRGTMHLKPVKIGQNVWIGSSCTILPGVTIEDGAIIGAGSVVTKNVSKNTVVAGNPAKVIKRIEVNDD